MATDRIHELERLARERAVSPAVEDDRLRTRTTAPVAARRVLLRHIGGLLIALGQKMSGTEGLPAAFDGHR